MGPSQPANTNSSSEKSYVAGWGRKRENEAGESRLARLKRRNRGSGARCSPVAGDFIGVFLLPAIQCSYSPPSRQSLALLPPKQSLARQIDSPRAKSRDETTNTRLFIPNPHIQALAIDAVPLSRRDVSALQEDLRAGAKGDPIACASSRSFPRDSSRSTGGHPFHVRTWRLVPSVPTAVHDALLHAVLVSWATSPRHGGFIGSRPLVGTSRHWFLCKYRRFRSASLGSGFLPTWWFA
ncbi:hypothetical protein EJB05_52683, partial [Eragrostis curvula]|uniref:Uncharacterized protein n=1 Tax=Eragrostis curvula TaxID=38414 RepID=A0A5J9SSC1_9POAL